MTTTEPFTRRLGRALRSDRTIQNPFWDIVHTIPGDPIYEKYDKVWRPDAYRLRELTRGQMPPEEYENLPTRHKLAEQYSWAIPSPGSLEFIVEQLDGRAVVEIGAGTGYWAWMLTQMGVDIRAYDKNPPREGENYFHCPKSEVEHTYTQDEHDEHHKRWSGLYDGAKAINDALVAEGREPTFPVQEYRPLPMKSWTRRVDGTPGKEYHPIGKGGIEALDLDGNQNRTLFLCWPPYDTPFGWSVIDAYQGDMIIYCGEGPGGCCGDDAMWTLLEEQWEEGETFWDHVQWSGIHDFITVYRRKS